MSYQYIFTCSLTPFFFNISSVCYWHNLHNSICSTVLTLSCLVLYSFSIRLIKPFLIWLTDFVLFFHLCKHFIIVLFFRYDITYFNYFIGLKVYFSPFTCPLQTKSNSRIPICFIEMLRLMLILDFILHGFETKIICTVSIIYFELLLMFSLGLGCSFHT